MDAKAVIMGDDARALIHSMITRGWMDDAFATSVTDATCLRPSPRSAMAMIVKAASTPFGAAITKVRARAHPPPRRGGAMTMR